MFSRLTQSSRKAIAYADALRKKSGLTEVHVEHLLQGLYYAKRHGPTRATFDNLSINPDQLQKRLADLDLDSHPPLSENPAALENLPAFSEHARVALQLAQEFADAGGATKVKSRHILAGIFALQDCEVPKAFPEVAPKIVDLVPQFRFVKRKSENSTDASDVFISYASEDRNRVKELAAALEAQGWLVWWDRTIPAGRKYDEVIDAALSAARSVVAIWSARSIAKDWVLEEAEEGRDRGVLIPVFIENVRPPRGFRRYQAADLTDWEGDLTAPDFQKLVTDIKAIVGLSPSDVPATKVQTNALGPFGLQEFSDEKVNDVLLRLRRLHENYGEFLPGPELLPELALLFNRKTFRYEPLRNCTDQRWSDRLDSAFQTFTVLQCYERNVRKTAFDKYSFFRDLLGEVGGYCMQMGALLFDPPVDYNIIKKHIGETTFKQHLPRSIEFPVGQSKRPVIPDDINEPIEEHRMKAVKLMDQIFS